MVLKRPLQISNGFWGDHHHWMFFGCLTIAINGFSMVFDFSTIGFNGFWWFRTIGQTMRWFWWIVMVYIRYKNVKITRYRHRPKDKEYSWPGLWLACLVCLTKKDKKRSPDSGWHEFASVHVKNGKAAGCREVSDQSQNLLNVSSLLQISFSTMTWAASKYINVVKI